MWTCPRCGLGFTPLKIYFHRMQCDGTSKLIKGTRPGRVSSKSVRMTSGQMRRADAIDAELRAGMCYPLRSSKKRPASIISAVPLTGSPTEGVECGMNLVSARKRQVIQPRLLN